MKDEKLRKALVDAGVIFGECSGIGPSARVDMLHLLELILELAKASGYVWVKNESSGHWVKEKRPLK